MGRRKKTGLGRALQRKQREVRSQTHAASSARHSHALDPRAAEPMYGVGSVTETNDLTAFLEAAELAERDFTAERGVALVVASESAATHSLLPSDLAEQEKVKALLQVPRRPGWTAETTKAELQKAERTSFLEWRAQLAQIEQNKAVHVTPFEKNINMWRQLWRVVEKSHVVVQILDARNPDLFRCTSLEDYVKDIDPTKRNILLVNKADLVPREIRLQWAAAWEEAGIEAVFFSAVAEQAKLDAAAKIANSLVADEFDSDGDDDVAAAAKAAEREADLAAAEPSVLENLEGPWEAGHLLTRNELIAHLTRTARSVQALMAEDGNVAPDGQLQQAIVGLVGYPNVGKSSTINALYGAKKTSVAATPGKTKHFQTLILSDDIMLCDCPGLVFPSFVSSQAEMVCSGVLPIDNLRSYYGPVSLVCQRIPRAVLEDVYGVALPPPGEGEDPHRAPFVTELLQAYAYNRGYMTQRGPDESRASRVILKDYVSGKLLYCFRPNEVALHEAAAAAAAERNAAISGNLLPHIMTAAEGSTPVADGLRDDIDAGFLASVPATATGARIVTPGTSNAEKAAPNSEQAKKRRVFADSKMAKDRAKIDAAFFSQTKVQAYSLSSAGATSSSTAGMVFASKKERRQARAREKAHARARKAEEEKREKQLRLLRKLRDEAAAQPTE
ncbi:uncharacterized protein AMSG_06673 [Thecamonas trahens ATCC 50062]|uniref:CP-type G domain-containing protein n=1 Tax=Thecamonas trahens ATCC 50062 TaxID=461836 RepID=A0A0L0DEL8_THETB|nr:hypothetical protein AMSG_06673 [Thecamonas trahens ATCC 50062]KNC50777.1 hypothetical protein AMSG_06673 [Thecamonas trahens ATCC 50062]|eukprot:XP_013756736.1 hypothetical protein AMSG_06673 [Thecamonas trahens ATCC 50062]